MLWVRVIKTIYGSHGGIVDATPRISDPHPWARIVALIFRLRDKGLINLDAFQRKIGDGSSTKFWEDCWSDGIILSNQYPHLYALENHKQCMVAEKSNNRDWFWSWRRQIRGGYEQAQLDDLMNRL